MERARIDVIVLDRIARLQDNGILKPFDRMQERFLHILGQGCGDAVRIDGRNILVLRQALRLEEDLVAVTLAEPDDLVLDRRTVARTDALDPTGIHGRAVNVVADDRMRRRVRPCDAARDLTVG